MADLALLEDAGVREEVFSTQLAVALNCTHTNHTVEMLECLQQADIGEIFVIKRTYQILVLAQPVKALVLEETLFKCLY